MKRERTSRRRFLTNVVLGGATAAATRWAGAERRREAGTDPERARLERIAARYGSELGELRKVRR